MDFAEIRAGMTRMRRKGSRKKASRAGQGQLAAHRLFVPLLGIWGAALAGLTLAVLPPAQTAQIATNAGLGVLGDSARLVLPILAAIFGGAIAFAVAHSLSVRAREKDTEEDTSLAAIAARRFRPIDPASELGSESLDAPIIKEPFAKQAPSEMAPEEAESEEVLLIAKPERKRSGANLTLGELAEINYELEPESDDTADEGDSDEVEWSFTRRDFEAALIETCESASENEAPDQSDVEEAAHSRPGPIELDLSEFAELPGRNAVWVQETIEEEPDAETNETEPEALEEVPVVEPETPAALAKLRAAPLEDLSLVQMVERFAAALHEHQESERAQPHLRNLGRDAALAEALKALTLFTEEGFDADFVGDPEAMTATTRELRDALAKLQDLRGAA